MKAKVGVGIWSLVAPQILQSVLEGRPQKYGRGSWDFDEGGAGDQSRQMGETSTIKDSETCKAHDMKEDQHYSVARMQSRICESHTEFILLLRNSCLGSSVPSGWPSSQSDSAGMLAPAAHTSPES